MAKTDEIPIRLSEELILLLLDEGSGYLEMVPGWDFSCIMAGAVLADLALEGRIDTDLEALFVADSSPTGDELLDPTLEEIVQSEETFDTQYWIERNASRSEEIVTGTLERLVNRGILEYESGGFWTLSSRVSRSGSYPTSDSNFRQEAKAPERHSERHHPGPVRCHPRRSDARMRRIQAPACAGGLRGKARANRGGCQVGLGRAVCCQRCEGERCQAKDPPHSPDQADPEARVRRHPATA